MKDDLNVEGEGKQREAQKRGGGEE